MYQEQILRMKKMKRINTYLTNNPTEYTVYTPVFYIWQNPSPHNRKTLPILNAPIETAQNRAIKSSVNQLNHPFLPATTFLTVYQVSHWFPTKRRAPGCSTQRPPFYRRSLIGPAGVPWQMTGLHSSKGIDKGCILELNESFCWVSCFVCVLVIHIDMMALELDG